MPSVLYSTTCCIKNNLYRLCIYVDDKEQNSTTNPLDTDSSEFISPDISVDAIIPSLTRLDFELINDKKNTNIPKTIILNHLLSIQQPQPSSEKNRDYFKTSYEILNANETITPVGELSHQASQVTLETQTSEVVIPETSALRRQFTFKRLFSAESYTDREGNPIFKTVINLSYVHVSNSIRWRVKKLKLDVETEDIANELYVNLNLCLSTLKQRPRHLLAFVNPFGGKGRAGFVYEKKVLPIFKHANITVNSIYTEHANHARDYVINEDLTEYDGLVCVGGDGMFAELCHGLLLRTSRQAQLNIDDPQVNIIRPDIRIGIIPAGSTDAVVFGTTGLNDPVTSALQIIVGESLSIDIATVHNEKGFVRFMATMLAYGFFGDIIQQSDKWRCLGPLRYDFAGFWQFIRHRSYHSELTITLSPNDSSQMYHLPMNNTNDGTTPSSGPDSHQLLNNNNPGTNGNNPINSSYEVTDKMITPALIFCSRDCETCAVEGAQNSTKDHLPSKIQREGRYTTINCLNMPCRCAKSKFGMSPFVHLGDGTFDLILVQRSWRTSFLRFLWQVANDGRSIEDLPNVERYRASEVLIRPRHTHRKRPGNWSCDGELISANEIRVRIHRQVLNLFASGIQFDKLLEYTPVKKNKPKKTLRDIFKLKK